LIVCEPDPRESNVADAAHSDRADRPNAVGDLEDMGLGYEVTNGSGGVVVSLRGELDLASAPELQRRLLELLSRPVDGLTLDLADLTFLDSSGLGALYRTRQAAGEQGVSLRLQEVPAHVMRVLDVTAMAQLFDLDARRA
jgi:anti-sigma B factor antagonist